MPQKVDQLQSIAALYFEEYSVDTTVILHQDYLSDDASGPESDTEETKDKWKQQMAREAGINCGTKDVDDDQMEEMYFLENIRPEWRSAEVRLDKST